MTLLISVVRNGLGVSDGMNFSQKGNITRHIHGTVRVLGGGGLESDTPGFNVGLWEVP